MCKIFHCLFPLSGNQLPHFTVILILISVNSNNATTSCDSLSTLIETYSYLQRGNYELEIIQAPVSASQVMKHQT
jgi:hypothetical protein